MRGSGEGGRRGEVERGCVYLMRFIYLIEFDITSPTNLTNITEKACGFRVHLTR